MVSATGLKWSTVHMLSMCLSSYRCIGEVGRAREIEVFESHKAKPSASLASQVL